jgi:hypothetical protein
MRFAVNVGIRSISGRFICLPGDTTIHPLSLSTMEEMELLFRHAGSLKPLRIKNRLGDKS